MELVGGTVVEHTYDADGTRVRTRTTPATGPPTTTDYLVDTLGLSQVVAETDETNTLKAYHARGDDLLATLRPEAGNPTDLVAHFFHAEGIGTIRAMTDEAAAVSDRYTLEAFGTLLAQDGEDPNAYLFAGEPLDPNSGFYYNRARWLDQSAGRFVSSDSLTGRKRDPRTLHRFLYAGQTPQQLSDPSGLDLSLGAAAIVGAVLAIVAVAYLANQRGLFRKAYDGVPIVIATRPVVVAGSGWDEDEALALVESSSALWYRMARIRIAPKPPIYLDAPNLLTLSGYIPIDRLAPIGGHVTLLTKSIEGGCGASPEAAGSLALSAVSGAFDPLSCISKGSVLAHEIGHHLLGPGHAPGIPGGLMAAGGGRAALSANEVGRARENARHQPFWR